MRVIIDDRSGFCFGVVKAIGRAEASLQRLGKVYSLGDIVHNRVEVQRLESLGLDTISLDEMKNLKGSTVLIRAHGEPPSTYALAKQCGVELIDATCPVVAKLQDKVIEAHRLMRVEGGQVVLLGKRGHAEVAGLTGQVAEPTIVIESIADLDNIDFSRPIYLLSQTTQSLDLFGEVTRLITSRAADSSRVTVDDTICRQVSNRNPHLREFASRFDVVIFVSGKKSSNGKVLLEVCREANPRSYFVEDAEELRAEWFENAETVGVCGATSTPKWLMQKVAAAIEKH